MTSVIHDMICGDCKEIYWFFKGLAVYGGYWIANLADMIQIELEEENAECVQ
jgi:hypothetical protein